MFFIDEGATADSMGFYVTSFIVGIIFMVIGVILNKFRCESLSKANSVKERFVAFLDPIYTIAAWIIYLVLINKAIKKT